MLFPAWPAIAPLERFELSTPKEQLTVSLPEEGMVIQGRKGKSWYSIISSGVTDLRFQNRTSARPLPTDHLVTTGDFGTRIGSDRPTDLRTSHTSLYCLKYAVYF